MGLTQKLGTIPLAILTDASNNVGIGAAPSGSYKLEVTGTAKVSSTILVSGAATFGSTITASGNLNLQAGAVRNINFYDSSNTNINAQIQYDQISATSGQLFFGTNNAGTFATRMTITSAGNVGIGVTPSNGWVNGKALEVGFVGSAVWGRYSNEFHLTNNYYYSASTNSRLYASTAQASDYEQYAGGHTWYTAPSGTINTAVTLTPRMAITNGGNVLIGTTTDNGNAKVQISGALQVQGAFNSTSASTGGIDYSGATTRFFSIGTGGATKGAFTFIAKGADDSSTTPLSITSTGLATFSTQVAIGTTVIGSYPLTLKALSGDTLFTGSSSNSTYAMDCYEDSTSGEFHMRNGSRDVYLARTAGTWVGNSDETIKENITLIENSLEKVLQLNGYYYNLIDDEDKNKCVGVIAQEVQKVLPEATHTSYSKTYDREIMGVEYDVLIPLLINSVKEQQAQIEKLKALIAAK